jgi:hypothetical protein
LPRPSFRSLALASLLAVLYVKRNNHRRVRSLAA